MFFDFKQRSIIKRFILNAKFILARDNGKYYMSLSLVLSLLLRARDANIPRIQRPEKITNPVLIPASRPG